MSAESSLVRHNDCVSLWNLPKAAIEALTASSTPARHNADVRILDVPILSSRIFTVLSNNLSNHQIVMDTNGNPEIGHGVQFRKLDVGALNRISDGDKEELAGVMGLASQGVPLSGDRNPILPLSNSDVGMILTAVQQALASGGVELSSVAINTLAGTKVEDGHSAEIPLAVVGASPAMRGASVTAPTVKMM